MAEWALGGTWTAALLALAVLLPGTVAARGSSLRIHDPEAFWRPGKWMIIVTK